MDDSRLEKFYVYRELGNMEKWNALLLDSGLFSLPSISFGMKVFATNEKEAITRARNLYEKICTNDNSKDNIRRFAAAALKSTLNSYKRWLKLDDDEVKKISKLTMKIAVALNKEYNKYFEQTQREDEPEEPK